MRVLVTGSAGHLGEALIRTLSKGPHDVVGVDRLDSPFTSHVGSVSDLGFVQRSMRGVDIVMHTATLHKPHMATHSRHAFVEANVAGTLNVLEAALAAGATLLPELPPLVVFLGILLVGLPLGAWYISRLKSFLA